MGNKYWFHLFALVQKLSHAAIIDLLFNHIIMQLVGGYSDLNLNCPIYIYIYIYR